MPSANADLNGLSNATLNASGNLGAAAPVPAGSDPTQAISSAQQQLTGVTTLSYPQDLPKYYMGFQVYKYQRADLMSIGSLSGALGQICLPFPEQMLDVNQVAFDKTAFSATIGNATDAVMKGVNGNGTLASGLGQTGAGALVDLVKAGTGNQGLGVVGAVGYSPNYFLTVVLNGPQYKQYTCNWTMAPRNPQEAAQLTQIIRIFKDSQAPGITSNGVLFTFPRIFQNYYGPNRGHLYQFKPSVLVSFAANYTPAGMPSMKQADQVTGNMNAPTALKLSATFMELEFWLRSDFGDAGFGSNPNQDLPIQPVPGTGRSSP